MPLPCAPEFLYIYLLLPNSCLISPKHLTSYKYSKMSEDIIEIVSNGDIILVVTKADYTPSFKVHASFLREAFPVFDRLLSPSFAEGQALLSDPKTPCKIKLIDNSPDCMQLVLNVIHGKSKKLPERVSAQQIQVRSINECFRP